jgi:hypothetical protein
MKKIFKKKCISDPNFFTIETGTTGIFLGPGALLHIELSYQVNSPRAGPPREE